MQDESLHSHHNADNLSSPSDQNEHALFIDPLVEKKLLRRIDIFIISIMGVSQLGRFICWKPNLTIATDTLPYVFP